MRGDACRKCGTAPVETKTGTLCAACLASGRKEQGAYALQFDKRRGINAPVVATKVSAGRKLKGVAATYAAQQSCPPDCVFKSHGCYAENGFLGGFITKRLNRAEPGITAFQVAEREAAAIDGLKADRDLRLHVVGDAATLECAIILAQAADRYLDRAAVPGVRVWTYTHAWREVPRWGWGRISVLASCETPADVVRAMGRGYAAELTVDRHTTDRLYQAGPLKVLPCPEQTRGVTCADCRLCMDDARLLDKEIVIAFSAHGRAAEARSSLRLARERERSRDDDGSGYDRDGTRDQVLAGPV